MFILDLNTPFDIPDDTKYLTVNNVTDHNIKSLSIPCSVTHLEINGSLKSYRVPPRIENLEICDVGLNEIILSEDIRWLTCTNNNLTHIELNRDIECVELADNKLSVITAREPLTKIKLLDIQDNNMEKLDVKLPNTMQAFYMVGNPELKIKYMGFLLNDYNDVIDGDFVDILGNGLLYREYVRVKLGDKTYQGAKYVDIKSLA